MTPGETLTIYAGCRGDVPHGLGGLGWGNGGAHGITHSGLAQDGGFDGRGSGVLKQDGSTELVVAGGGGGGGGGGYPTGGGHGHGGDEGGGGGGGGGGNSYAAASVTDTSFVTSSLAGDGQITLSWTPSQVAPGPTTPAPAQPMTVTGEVHHVIPPLVSENQIEQSLIPHTGATVEALVGSTVCGTAVTDATGRFQMTVAAHPATPGCGRPGATVRFRVEGTEHPETVPFVSGGAAAVALRSADAPRVPLYWP